MTFLRNTAAALKPGGRIGIVNYKPGRGGPGPSPDEGVRVESAAVEKDARAAGLRVLAQQTLPYQAARPRTLSLYWALTLAIQSAMMNSTGSTATFIDTLASRPDAHPWAIKLQQWFSSRA